MSKQYAHLHTMAKKSVKFQNDWTKTVGGVALTRHPLTIMVLGQNWLSLQSEKVEKKIWELWANNMHIYTPWSKHLWSFKMIGQKLWEELRSRDTHWLLGF